MKIRKVINKPLMGEKKGVKLAGGINAVVSANVNEKGGSVSRVSSRQRIVQKNGKTEVFEEHTETGGDHG